MRVCLYGCLRGRRSLDRIVLPTLVAVLAGALRPTDAVAQIVGNYPTNAKVEYRLNGTMYQQGEPPVPLLDADLMTTTNSLQNPVALAGVIGGDFSSTTGNASIAAIATAAAGPGLMRLGAAGTTAASWNAGAWTAGASISSSYLRAEWDETFLIAVPTGPQPGRQLVVNALLMIDGGLSFSGSASDSLAGVDGSGAFYRLALTARNAGGTTLLGSGFAAGQQNAFAKYDGSNGGAPLDSPLPDAIAVTMAVVEGQLAYMKFNAEMTFSANSGPAFSRPAGEAGSATGTFNADFSHTIAWGGITSIVDPSTGLAVEGWTIESASGVDYSQAIPEPSTFMACAAAAALTSLARRRRYSTHVGWRDRR